MKASDYISCTQL